MFAKLHFRKCEMLINSSSIGRKCVIVNETKQDIFYLGGELMVHFSNLNGIIAYYINSVINAINIHSQNACDDQNRDLPVATIILFFLLLLSREKFHCF